MTNIEKIVAFSYERGSDLVEVQAIVEDCILLSPQTLLDPEEWGPAHCTTTLLWDEPIVPGVNEPTKEDIEKMAPWAHWEVTPPIGFEEDF
tara:strand:+ start:10299 stop:10571 length:273 start_codon:yes stop_codon:yes gene_type:complete